jgi:hypothetical protein
VGDVIVARTMEEGFRSLIQSMGIGNLKPNMVCMRYPEIWRDERRQLGNIPNQVRVTFGAWELAVKAAGAIDSLFQDASSQLPSFYR